MTSHRLPQLTLATCVIVGAAFLVLASLADWTPRVLFRQYLPATDRFDSDYTAEIRRVIAVRTPRSLFNHSHNLMTYECRIRLGHQIVTSNSFRFADGFRPEVFAVTSTPVDRGVRRIVFTFNGGNPMACDFHWGNSSYWSWAK